MTATNPGSLTGKELLQLIARERKTRSLEVLAHPGRFMICEGCSSMIYNRPGRDGHCPFCGAYRFNHDHDAIRELALLLGDRPLAVGCAVLPRCAPGQTIPI